ncbi:hypothetical protein [Rhizobium alvei]|uniref:Uncharacterized protein n=1 Tax=Rhizobium alvei TaxID=1132659 RepID=A0ABT8YK59_9HYPH|nr:hypothetical protein [Rhizobium alvei]MDO6963989.1 hypothetical protein [Rhizobium alvei]
MKAPSKKSLAGDIEEEVSILRDRLVDQERRHAAALEALESGRQARRAVLTKNPSAIEAATAKVRALQLDAEDAGSLAQDYRDELEAAELRLAEAAGIEKRTTTAATFHSIAEVAEAHATAIADAIAGLMAVRKSLLAAIPADAGLLPGYHSHRPDNRKGDSRAPLSGRELVDAVIAEGLYHFAPEMFDEESGGFGRRYALAKLMDLNSVMPCYVGPVAPGLAPAEALKVLLIKPAKERARQILAGEVEAIAGQIIRIDQARPQDRARLQIVATKPLKFVTPERDGFRICEIEEGEQAAIIEPIARLAIAKRAAIEVNTPAGQLFLKKLEKRKELGQEQPPADVVDLGDPMGAMDPANDDEIAEEVTRAIG